MRKKIARGYLDKCLGKVGARLLHCSGGTLLKVLGKVLENHEAIESVGASREVLERQCSGRMGVLATLVLGNMARGRC